MRSRSSYTSSGLIGLTNLLLASELFELESTLAGRFTVLYDAALAGVDSAGRSYRLLIFGGGARGGPMLLADCAKFCGGNISHC